MHDIPMLSGDGVYNMVVEVIVTIMMMTMMVMTTTTVMVMMMLIQTRFRDGPTLKWRLT